MEIDDNAQVGRNGFVEEEKCIGDVETIMYRIKGK